MENPAQSWIACQKTIQNDRKDSKSFQGLVSSVANHKSSGEAKEEMLEIVREIQKGECQRKRHAVNMESIEHLKAIYFKAIHKGFIPKSFIRFIINYEWKSTTPSIG